MRGYDLKALGNLSNEIGVEMQKTIQGDTELGVLLRKFLTEYPDLFLSIEVSQPHTIIQVFDGSKAKQNL